ncbi:MAG: hypothetical protein AUK31_07210 [Fibrobacteres bacterium CG2_30_45_31]|nr:MAG: hypothetical protein AUK31_07210 [Fibrobacteres bacterium CG2_30_45_31]
MTPEKQIKKLLHETSPGRTLFYAFVLILMVLFAIMVRLYAIEPLVLNDASMYPLIPEGKRVWVCKLPYCIEKVKKGDILLVKRPGGEFQLRRIKAGPGDTLEIEAGDQEGAFIATRKFYIPKAGDTLFLNRLNDVSFDYASNLLREQEGIRKFRVEASLWQGNHELSLDRVGRTRIGARPVGLREVHGLPWQELYLIQLQIQREEPGSNRIQIRRQLFSTKDSSELKSFVVKEDCYFLTCSKRSRCPDSRELGFFTQSQILGRLIQKPAFFPF